ncbi:MAG TPA: hypothetical protein VIR58_16345 [Acidimicrobiales bacterium]
MFLGARFDAGLAWLDFPRGHGGLGASRRWQSFVERRFREAGVPSPMCNFIGVGMAGPTIAAEGTDDQALPAGLLQLRGCGDSCSASRVPAPTWPRSPPAPSAAVASG